MPSKDQLIENAAREVIAHGGPACLTDPHQVLVAMNAALDAGATHDDIVAAMKRSRGEG
jgi:alkylhydroperoxidase/carboxymuconolactone decarboxylase family protein YurZ